jgi:hypothetical protein
LPYQPEFDRDLRDGEAGEEAFVHVMCRTLVEHKRDRWCQRTGNVAIEFEQRHQDGAVRPSGIQLSRAGRYAIEWAPECWLVVPKEVAVELGQRAVREGREAWIGSGNNYHNALVPFEWFCRAPDPFPSRD